MGRGRIPESRANTAGTVHGGSCIGLKTVLLREETSLRCLSKERAPVESIDTQNRGQSSARMVSWSTLFADSPRCIRARLVGSNISNVRLTYNRMRSHNRSAYSREKYILFVLFPCFLMSAVVRPFFWIHTLYVTSPFLFWRM